MTGQHDFRLMMDLREKNGALQRSYVCNNCLQNMNHAAPVCPGRLPERKPEQEKSK